jgi:hypothetical protein
MIRQAAGELGSKEQSGAVRETFFAHQIKSAGMHVRIPTQGDLLVDGMYFFEVGGKGKDKGRLKDNPNAFVVRDDREVGFGKIIPLWLFGLFY